MVWKLVAASRRKPDRSRRRKTVKQRVRLTRCQQRDPQAETSRDAEEPRALAARLCLAGADLVAYGIDRAGCNRRGNVRGLGVGEVVGEAGLRLSPETIVVLGISVGHGTRETQGQTAEAEAEGSQAEDGLGCDADAGADGVMVSGGGGGRCRVGFRQIRIPTVPTPTVLETGSVVCSPASTYVVDDGGARFMLGCRLREALSVQVSVVAIGSLDIPDVSGGSKVAENLLPKAQPPGCCTYIRDHHHHHHHQHQHQHQRRYATASQFTLSRCKRNKPLSLSRVFKDGIDQGDAPASSSPYRPPQSVARHGVAKPNLLSGFLPDPSSLDDAPLLPPRTRIPKSKMRVSPRERLAPFGGSFDASLGGSLGGFA
ncbi:hypothetical protein G7046_g6111 [Stylonectria norvegica]|nr:hypothetical protein G7046_g6111 [Stylonectria norvegica]